jgi:hypothetical protein
MLLIFAVSANAGTQLTFQNQSLVHDCEETLTVTVQADDAIKCFDMVAELAEASGGAFAEVTNVILHTACGSDEGFDLGLVDGVDSDTFRFWGCDLTSCCDVIPAGTQVLAEIVVQVGSATGSFTIDGGQITIVDGVVVAEPNFVDGNSESTNLTINAGTYQVINNAPVFTNCPSLIEHACSDGTINFDFDAEDNDCGTTLTYSLGPNTGGSINPTTGVWSKNVSAMCGVYDYQVIVTDEHNAQAVCNFTLSVTTEAPEIVQCEDVRVAWGDLAEGQVIATDPDGCPSTLTYSLVGVTGNGGAPFPGVIAFNAATGEWSVQTVYQDYDWVTTPDEPWHVTIEASDGCESAICQFDLIVTALRVELAKLHGDNGKGVYQGSYQFVPVNAYIDGERIGGYDLLISYDASALNFIDATMGADLEACGWEYFTYRSGPQGNCGSACPSGMIRIIALAESNDGPHHPDCFPNGQIELAVLKFFVTNDRRFECQYIPINFFWLDCGDNTLSSVSGDTLFVDREVYWYSEPDSEFVPQVNAVGGPYSGWQALGLDCTHDPDGDGPKIGGLDYVDFYSGGIDIVCADSIDGRGDLNLNDIANEIADAVLYTNYFIYGMSVFSSIEQTRQGQIAASDVNNDGRILTVGDLVYLVRVLTGDALPIAKLTPFASEANIYVENGLNGTTVSTRSSVDIGAALFVFDVEGNASVEPLVSGMDVKSDMVDGQLRVLVYNIGKSSIVAGSNDLFNIVSNGDVTLIESSAADYYGNELNMTQTSKVLPKNFALKQNFPNPFNPSTSITIQLPEASQYKIEIYNVSGQLVKSISGYGVGEVTEVVDFSGQASGIYFYKATAGQFTDTKKMVLMK